MNRYRLDDYKREFEANFGRVEFKVLQRLVNEFRKAQNQIRAEFKTGDEAVDSVGLIHVVAREPK